MARKAAAFGASAAVLAAMAAGLVASPAQAATSAAAGKAGTATAAKSTKSGKVSVTTPKVSSKDYQGSCPVNLRFSSRISVPVKGKTELAYRWLHGDGSKGKVQVVKLKGHGTKSVTVKESVTFKGEVKGWEAVQVLGPKKVTSKKGYFSVSCADQGGRNDGDDRSGVRTDKDVSVSARAWASPSSYEGACTPGDKIDFTGLISVNHPTWVRYRWILNGEVADHGKVKVWNKRKVGFGISPRHSQRGWAQLEIVGPDDALSNRAYYKVWCKDSTPAPAVKVSATNLVTATNHNGCKVGAHATVSATGAARVQYTWAVNGESVAKGESLFAGSGSKTVELSEQALTGEAAKGGKITLTVTGPNNNDSITQSYAACEAPKPTASVSSVSVTNTRTDMCKDNRGPGVDFSATLHSTGPTTVRYYWVVNGVKDVNVLERQVNGDLAVTWGVGGTQNSKETKGTIELVVVSPNAASSGVANYSATCPKADA
ncbi:hypothetical protein AB0C33_33120 [Nonomuraea sp. NPDC048881]|uniref:hypothetical protein n=1 Tax=Nonomuraea sp. NPDC048881 TaxID=3155030 RepID=UPI0033EE538C